MARLLRPKMEIPRCVCAVSQCGDTRLFSQQPRGAAPTDGLPGNHSMVDTRCG